MTENRPGFDFACHAILIVGVLILAFPIWVALVGSTHTQERMLVSPLPLWFGGEAIANYNTVLFGGTGTGFRQAGLTVALTNSLVMALGITIGKIAISSVAAFAIVYFRFPFRKIAFWTIFLTLMLPVEVRIIPTYEVVSDLNMLDSYSGLILPLIASATATFLYRQFFLTIPDELAEAARIDGAGPLRFFWDIVVPMSRTNTAALFVILFIYGWNQYLWPLLITTKAQYATAVVTVTRQATVTEAAPEWQLVTAMAILCILPPVLVVLFMQRHFVKGLAEVEK